MEHSAFSGLLPNSRPSTRNRQSASTGSALNGKVAVRHGRTPNPFGWPVPKRVPFGTKTQSNVSYAARRKTVRFYRQLLAGAFL